MSRPALPVNVIGGALGAGKTTLISALMAAKPEAERWVVLLNEFSPSGIDALTVAGAARGAYDVQLVPGGCLCCSGELDFARRLRQILRDGQCERLLIEPSGLGHPARMIEPLLQWQQQGALRLAAVLCLLEPTTLGRLDRADAELLRAQIQVADTLLLSKADTASSEQLAQWHACVASLYPPPRRHGLLQAGRLPLEWLESGTDYESLRGQIGDPHASWRNTDRLGHSHEHGTASGVEEPVASMNGAWRQTTHELGHEAVSWRFERDWQFARPALLGGLQALLRDLPSLRFKAVLRSGPEHWLLVQSSGGALDVQESAWRRDSRAEWLLPAGQWADSTAWEQLWRTVATRVPPE
ncbi:MAG: GTP-binding protein [Steroidobacteraceae bacterium]